ncbi:septum formation protein [Palleronia salina]|uniref:Nucleoside triphosphate pyrophosphatase n=1 Tax=Palleronia salina TaxID=313368 RepID=A0A1M6CV03_9RHOB|nr:Maf family nucleotide pyrophosphatase [Palleronia salina]SHI64790.1 septum formation protein [Palleronia salina]
MNLILASGSTIRAQLLRQAGLSFETVVARIDEESVKLSLAAEGAAPRDIADALAEAKARKVSLKHPGALVLGCDQVLSLKGEVLSKPRDPDDARAQLRRLSDMRHNLLSAVVAYEDGEPLWRFVDTVRLSMRALSDDFIDDYVSRNWDSIRHSVGGYKLEEEGMRLFRAVEGDYFTVLGLPMIPLLSWLIDRGSLTV